jgi:hypothetical protein
MFAVREFFKAEVTSLELLHDVGEFRFWHCAFH